MRGILAVLLALFFATSAMAQSMSVAVRDGGQLRFDSFSLKSGYYPQPSGSVTNDSPFDFLGVQIEVLAFDKKGRKLLGGFDQQTPLKFNVSRIRHGETQVLGEANKIFEALNGTPVRYELHYVSSVRWTTKKYAMVTPGLSKELRFDDPSIGISFVVVDDNQITFELQNKTGEPISIDWNKVAYVDPASESHRVMHKGVKFVDRDNVLPATLVPPMAKLTDLIFPISHVRWSTVLREWMQDPIFPSGEAALTLKGKTFGIFMPLILEGEIKNYNFTFSIDVGYSEENR
jgi:hypothetical protein